MNRMHTSIYRNIFLNRGIALLLMMLLFFAMTTSCAATSAVKDQTDPERVIVENGVMYWADSGKEVALFGVNYQPAFAHSHRALRILEKDHKEAIDEDTYHFSRMGFDAYRIHMWDREITDSLGNLLKNEHLDLHDYTVYKMNERGIKTVITPTTYYSNAYPDGATPAPGFSNHISKADAPQNPENIPIIQNYLDQLINHTNPYTGMTSVEDPNIIALEIDNEPNHSGYEQTLNFVNALANHLRESGWDKPIFYNITHGEPDAYLDADIDGVTFQWYPAGLVGGETIRKNYFPYVNKYPIVWEDDDRLQDMALLVYEFDPADNMHNYSLPMMARSFRETGIQWATQFAYDPLAFANQNSDYPTHFLNLAYTPNKAVSAAIASEIFNRIDRRQQFEDYPADTTFGDFLMSHHLDLSQLNSEDMFLYSNNTDTFPQNEAVLERIVGAGSSPVVSYSGTGAYFLDKLESGIWRLEMMPDAIQVRDPFERPDFNKYNVHLEWHEHPIQINLNDLGSSFSVKGLNEGNRFSSKANGGTVIISPGAYLLTRDGISSSDWGPDSQLGRITIGEYHAVPTTTDEPIVYHRQAETAEAGQPLRISANAAGLMKDDKVILRASPLVGQSQNIEMEEVSAHHYEAKIPGEIVSIGELSYWIVIDRAGNDEYVTFPGNNPSAPWLWNYYYDDKWSVKVKQSGEPIELYNAIRDYQATNTGFSSGGSSNKSELVATENLGQVVRSLSSPNPTSHRHILGLAMDIGERLKGITSSTLDSYREIVVRAKTDFNNSADMKIVIVDHDANAYSAVIPIDDSLRDHRIPLSSFEPDRYMLLPRSYPGMMESWYKTGMPGPVRISHIEEIQFLIDTSDFADFSDERYGFEIESALLNGYRSPG